MADMAPSEEDLSKALIANIYLYIHLYGSYRICTTAADQNEVVNMIIDICIFYGGVRIFFVLDRCSF